MKEITNKDVCIVIPIYKDNINNKLIEDEKNSIINTIRLMKNYDIYFLCNENLDIIYYKKLKSCSQPNIFFKHYNFYDLGQYSDMCLKNDFYELFNEYEYILLCQSDAWVFRDELLYWCNKGYDYIGAPYLSECDEMIEKYLETNYNDIPEYLHFNGGFSLRNIKTFCNITKNYEKLIKKCKTAEDVFISRSLNTYLKMPTIKDAGLFSMEQHILKDIYHKYFGDTIPFGCHSYSTRQYLDTW